MTNKVVSLVLVVLSACSSVSDVRVGKCDSYAQALASEDPKAKAERVVREGAPYLLGVQGYAVQVPGAEERHLSLIGHRIIEGTGDAHEDQSCQDYQKRALEYARTFNLRILELVF